MSVSASLTSSGRAQDHSIAGSRGSGSGVADESLSTRIQLKRRYRCCKSSCHIGLQHISGILVEGGRK